MKLLILDGNSVINRAYFGVKPLTTREGLYTHAIYGFLNTADRVHTVSGTCAHALPISSLPAFVHCIYMQKTTRYEALSFNEIERKQECRNYYCGV